jgi:type IV pilus assembly protein PilA
MKHTKNEKGFTLVELMIVIAIIGILAAIAIPQMSAYRDRAYNTAALSDCRNLITAMEAYHIDYGQYPMDNEQSGTTTWVLNEETGLDGNILPELERYGFKLSDGVTAESINVDYNTYVINSMYNYKTAENRRVDYSYDSTYGEIVTGISEVTP